MPEKQINRDDALKVGKLFASPAGKQALKVLRAMFYDQISFEPGDQHVTAFNEGHRDVVQFIINAAEAAGKE